MEDKINDQGAWEGNETALAAWPTHVAHAERLAGKAEARRENNAAMAGVMLDQARVHLQIAQTILYAEQIHRLAVAAAIGSRPMKGWQ
jgi:hypothetical protein